MVVFANPGVSLEDAAGGDGDGDDSGYDYVRSPPASYLVILFGFLSTGVFLGLGFQITGFIQHVSLADNQGFEGSDLPCPDI